MWQYNYTTPYNELYHYGVKGVKWKNHTYATREELEAAKKKYKTEKQEFKADRKVVYKELKKNKTVVDLKNGDILPTAGLMAGLVATRRKNGQSAKVKEEYAQKVLDSALKKYRRSTIAEIVGSTAFLAGVAIIPNIISKVTQ